MNTDTCMQVTSVVLMAVSGLSILLLSPLVVDLVNLFRAKDRKLLASEEIADAYDFHLARIFICEACQSFWATLIAVWLSAAPHKVQLFFMCYAPVLVTWLCVKALYRKLH